jgi:hypothetical protein
MILGQGIVLLSGFYVPTNSLYLISFNAKTLFETAREQPLAFANTKLSGPLPFRQAFVKIFAYVRPATPAFGDGTFTLSSIVDAALAQSLEVIILSGSTLRAKPRVFGNLLPALGTFHKTALPT